MEKTQTNIMEVNSIDLENAFLAWINGLAITHKKNTRIIREKITSIKQLKDGIALIRILHSMYYYRCRSFHRYQNSHRNETAFPIEGFNQNAHDHWAFCVANLQKLSTYMQQYLENVLQLPIDKNYINIPSIANGEERTLLLRLCEVTLGIACNSEKHEEYVDPMLTLEESQQTILMDIMVKYVRPEEGRKSALAVDAELIESMQQQLKDKETDRKGVMEEVAKLEGENKEISKNLQEAEKKCKSLEKENQQLHSLMDELAKKTAAVEPMTGIDPAREHDLETDVAKLQTQVKTLSTDMSKQKKAYEMEKGQLKDELYIANQKAMKVAGLEKLVEQQRNQIEGLKAIIEEQKPVLNKIELYETQIQELEKNKQALVQECKAVTGKFYAEKNDNKFAQESAKKARDKSVKLEEDVATLDRNKKYWEQRAKQAEDKAKATMEENDHLRLSANAGNLLSLEQETKYKKKIEALEERVSLISENSNARLVARISELEGKLEAAKAVNIKLEQELALRNKQHDDLQKENKALSEELEGFRRIGKSHTVELNEDLYRIKKDRDTLLGLMAKANQDSANFEGLKKTHEELKTSSKALQEKYEIVCKENDEHELSMGTKNNLKVSKKI